MLYFMSCAKHYVQKGFWFVVVVWFVITSSFVGCRSDGCKKDTDCKGDRVCESGRCLYPPKNIKSDLKSEAKIAAQVQTKESLTKSNSPIKSKTLPSKTVHGFLRSPEKPRALRIYTGHPSRYGALDKEIIRRVINQHRAQVKYCYEKRLLKKPELEGRVKVFFVIAGTGNVKEARISSTTMNDVHVEECIVRRVNTWRFPAPKGGGIVQVNYPFLFKPR